MIDVKERLHEIVEKSRLADNQLMELMVGRDGLEISRLSGKREGVMLMADHIRLLLADIDEEGM